jgi:hypothetical protein
MSKKSADAPPYSLPARICPVLFIHEFAEMAIGGAEAVLKQDIGKPDCCDPVGSC